MHLFAKGGVMMRLRSYIEGLSYGDNETFESGIEKIFSIIIMVIMLYATLVL